MKNICVMDKKEEHQKLILENEYYRLTVSENNLILCHSFE